MSEEPIYSTEIQMVSEVPNSETTENQPMDGPNSHLLQSTTTNSPQIRDGHSALTELERSNSIGKIGADVLSPIVTRFSTDNENGDSELPSSQRPVFQVNGAEENTDVANEEHPNSPTSEPSNCQRSSLDLPSEALQTASNDAVSAAARRDPLHEESSRGLALVQRLRSVMFRRRMSRPSFDVSILQDDTDDAPLVTIMDRGVDTPPIPESETSTLHSDPVILVPQVPATAIDDNSVLNEDQPVPKPPLASENAETNDMELSNDFSDENEYYFNSFVDEGDPVDHTAVAIHSMSSNTTFFAHSGVSSLGNKVGNDNETLSGETLYANGINHSEERLNNDPLQTALAISKSISRENEEVSGISMQKSFQSFESSVDAAQSDKNVSQQSLDTSFDSAVARSFEITKTTEELGLTSKELMQQLRGASFRRKMNLARSRDSLAAKERQQLEVNAALEAARMEKQAQVLESNPQSTIPIKKVQPGQGFIARPLPKTTGSSGSGGLAGVPKVEKKPTTTPISPFLGAKRQMRVLESESENCTTSKPKQTFSSNAFKARPLPRTNGLFGGAGQVGVPKVQKRQVTVPESPLLGARRPRTVSDKRASLPPRVRRTDVRRPSNTSLASTSTQDTLLGLELCSQKENENLATPPPRPNASKAFIPHSTDRAKRRATFDSIRVQNEHERKKEEQEVRKAQVRALQRELKELRLSI